MGIQLLAQEPYQHLQQQHQQQLVSLLLFLLLLGLPCAADQNSFCLRSVSPPDAADFARGSRRMPPKAPALAAYDWDGGPANQQQLTSHYKPCHAEAPIFRYKVVKGVVYIDHDHDDARYKLYRDGFLEQLVLVSAAAAAAAAAAASNCFLKCCFLDAAAALIQAATCTQDSYLHPPSCCLVSSLQVIFLYKDFPDVDLVVDFTDHPQLCDQHIPFLRFSIFNASGLGSPQQQKQYNITDLLAPAWIPHGYGNKHAATAAAASVPSHPPGQQSSSSTSSSAALKLPLYTRGFTMPSPEAWRVMSLTPAQLQEYQRCLQETYPWSAKRRVLFWRGQATGCSRGWPTPGLQESTAAADGSASEAAAGTAAQRQQPQPHLLRNKRVQAALRLFPYADMADVRISSLPELTPECLGAAAQTHSYHVRRRQPMHVRQQQISVGHHVGSSLDREDEDAYAQFVGGGGDNAADVADARLVGLQAAVEGSSAQAARLASPKTALHARALAGRVALAQEEEAGSAAATAAGAGHGRNDAVPDNPVIKARAFRALAMLLHGEAVGLEAWASSAATLSLDGYGPPFRLPQQLLLPAAVLKQTSPYQPWLDWELQPGVHHEQLAYNLSDLEEKVFAMLGVDGDSSSTLQSAWERLQGMAEAAHGVVAAKVNVFAQLDAFAWSVARYKEACPWDVVAPAADERMFHVVQLNPNEVFNSPGVPESVRLLVMQQMRSNFAAALKLPAYAAAGGG
jgi:hypothetical protein